MTSSWRRAIWSCCTADFQVPGYLQIGLPRILFDCMMENLSSTGTYFRMRPPRRRPRAGCLCLEARFPLRGCTDNCSVTATQEPPGHGLSLWPKSPRAAVVRMRATTTNIDIVRDRYRYVGAGWQSWATDKLSLIMRRGRR